MNIRIMTVKDYNKVFELWVNTPGMGLNQIDDSRDGIEKYLKRNPTTSFVAEENDMIIGTILAGHDGRRGYIYHTAILPEYRSQGTAKALVENAMNALEKEGISKTALVVFKANAVGNVFWENIGFSTRNDLVYRNKNMHELTKINT